MAEISFPFKIILCGLTKQLFNHMSCWAVVPQSLMVFLFSSIHLINTGFLTPAWCISLMTWKKRKSDYLPFWWQESLPSELLSALLWILELTSWRRMLAEGIPMPWERESIGPTLYIAYLNIGIKRTELFAQYGEPVGSLTDVEKFCAWCGNQYGAFSNFYFTLSSPVGSWMSSWSIMYSAKDLILCPREVLLVCEHKSKGLFINVLLQRLLICSILSQKEAQLLFFGQWGLEPPKHQNTIHKFGLPWHGGRIYKQSF